MKKILMFGLLLIFVASCGVVEETSTEEEIEVWVCHNPLSELHGSACIEKVNIYRGRHQPCYWVAGQRVKNSYCWLLVKEDCSEPEEGSRRLGWQEEHCPLLEK